MTTAPGYKQWIPLPYGAFGEILRDPLSFQLRAQKQLGDVVRFRNGPILVHFLYHPDHVRLVLQERQRNYLRGWQYRLLHRLFGDSLVVSEGDFWVRERRLAQPAFHRERLEMYAQIMVRATDGLLTRWRRIAASGQPLDVGPEMSRLALEIAGRTLFSRDVSAEADAVGSAFSVVGGYLENRFNHAFTSAPLWMPTRANARFRRARRTLNEIAMTLIRERRRTGGDQGDLLSMLIQVRDEETGEQMTDDQVRSEALTFLIAGHETTATALTWTWFLLACDRATQQRVRDEAGTVLGDRAPAMADLPRLSVTRMVIEEAMRLYPPIWAVSRQATADDTIGGFHIPARSLIVLSSFVTHRHPDFWEAPDEFDPDRFSPERSAKRPKTAYFPFLTGPHQCIGNEFAMAEMRLIVALTVRHFDLELMPGQDIRPKPSLTLRPSGPVRLRLRSA